VPAATIYRVQQLVQAMGSWFEAEEADDGTVAGTLPAGAVTLFRAMPRYDRRHALRVVRTLQARGRSEPDLVAAALLHDMGKCGPQAGPGQRASRVQLWHRVATVLVRATWPGLLERIGQNSRQGSWRYPFYVQLHHATIGALLAEQAGCSPRTVDLIRRHEDAAAVAGDPLLAALQEADNQS
jgi:hypothetical protein